MSHELSGGKVELDLNQLIKVAAQACKNSRAQMNHYLREVDSGIMHGKINQSNSEIYELNHHAQFYARYMAESAKEYADAMHTYYVLVESLHREEIIINKE